MKNDTTKRKVLGIGIDGVIRDMHSQFDKVYRKAFIKNEALVKMDDNFRYLPSEEMTEEEENKIIKIANEKIHFPVDTFDLLNHYYFENREDFDKFFDDYAFEIFGSASQYPRTLDQINRLQNFGEVNDIFDVILLSKEKDKAVSSTYHFLAKSGCKIRNVRFVDEYSDKWNYCDVIIDDCPAVFENKPEEKTSIKINREYNTYTNADYSFNSVGEIYNERFLIKVFAPERLNEEEEKSEEK